MTTRAARIVVVGSVNTDLVVRVPAIPRPGETVIGGTFTSAGGGKGANQAVAAARAGAEVAFVGRVGADAMGDAAIAAFRTEGVDTCFLTRDPSAPSGVALILVDEGGENSIAVAPGANDCLRPNHIDAARDLIAQADVLLIQLEIPLETVIHAVALAEAAGVPVILNPAPAQPLPPDSLAQVTILTPNETEAALLSGAPVDTAESAAAAARCLLRSGPRGVVVTLGSRGAVVATAERESRVPAHRISAVDSVAAGDVFNGCLAVAIAEGNDLDAAVRFATAAAAISVTRHGAQASAPLRAEIEALLGRTAVDSRSPRT